MAKDRTFICHGSHAIMKVQAHVPKGWKLDWVAVAGTRVLAWFCPKCLPERAEK